MVCIALEPKTSSESLDITMHYQCGSFLAGLFLSVQWIGRGVQCFDRDYKLTWTFNLEWRIYDFPFRRGQYLSISNEHITEIELREILDPLLSEYNREFTSSAPQYSVFIENKAYVLAVEMDEEKEENESRLEQIGQELRSKFDQKLQESNEEYRQGRKKQKISAPTVLWLNNNTLTTGTREYRLKKNKGSGANQLKSQLIFKSENKDVIKFIEDRKVLKIK